METSESSPRSGFPRSLDLTVMGLALIIDQIVTIFYAGKANPARLGSYFSSLPLLRQALLFGYLAAGIAVLALGVLWRPPSAGFKKIGWGIKAYSLYTGLSFFALVLAFELPAFQPSTQRQAAIGGFLAAMFIIIFGSVLYVLSKSLWSVSNLARLTAVALYAFVIVLTILAPSSDSVIPGLILPAALIWYMFRNHVRALYSPPPPPEAANYVLRTRVETRKCSNCGFENDRKAKVCEKCSAPLGSVTSAGAKPMGTIPSMMISAEDELKTIEARLNQLIEFRKGHTLLNPESYDGLIELNKKRLEELQAMVPNRKSTISSRQA